MGIAPSEIIGTCLHMPSRADTAWSSKKQTGSGPSGVGEKTRKGNQQSGNDLPEEMPWRTTANILRIRSGFVRWASLSQKSATAMQPADGRDEPTSLPDRPQGILWRPTYTEELVVRRPSGTATRFAAVSCLAMCVTFAVLTHQREKRRQRGTVLCEKRCQIVGTQGGPHAMIASS